MLSSLFKKTDIELEKLKRQNNYIYKILRWFPVKNPKLFVRLYTKVFQEISLGDSLQHARIKGDSNKEIYEFLISKYSFMPTEALNNEKTIIDIAKDFLAGAPIWKSPLLQYNVGAATNTAANVLYAISQEINLYNINDGLAGNCLAAEKAVCRILSSMAEVDPDVATGLFTFGGTATNLYAIKIGITKALPGSKKDGLKDKIKVAITEDSHFSHTTSLNWLGVGESNAIIMKANKDRTTNIQLAENDIKKAIEEGFIVPVIVINGGTTYDNAIDDITEFVKLRNQLVKKYKLNYIPHIHVDSVIGWSFLFFNKYDFKKNILNIENNTLAKLETQSKRINGISKADSWGVDFHKGIGSSPIPCSVVMLNNSESLATLLQQNEDGSNLHQLAQEFSHMSPVSYTLETSRPGGSALAGLASIFAMGEKGFQSHLANLVQMSTLTRKLIEKDRRFNVVNKDCLGFVTMIQLIPLSLEDSGLVNSQLTDNSQSTSDYICELNDYNERFFSFDKKVRISKNIGVEYSFSKGYCSTPSGVKISAIKLYPTSPLITPKHIVETIETLKTRKQAFDKTS